MSHIPPWQVKDLSRQTARAMDEIIQCVRIQKELGWDWEIVPSHVLRADSIGLIDDCIDLGYILLAFLKKDPAHTVLGFARVTYTRNSEEHWLHEVAVSSRFQSRGAGLCIMKAVKTKSILLGASRLYFTYDPFEGKSGNLYMTKCGAKAVKVFDNLYGGVKSPAHEGRKSHRFLMEWNLLADGVREGPRFSKHGDAPVISSLAEFDSEPMMRVRIPYRLDDLSEKETAEWQNKVFPILFETINNRNYRAVSVQTMPESLENFLVLESSGRS